MGNLNLKIFKETYHTDNDEFKLYMRVRCGDVIGEIVKKNKNKLKIQYSENYVSGWNNQLQFKTKTFKICDCKKIDQGINSPWSFNVDNFLSMY